MKKSVLFTAVFLIIISILVSCKTVSGTDTGYTEEEASQAIHNTLNRAIENTNTRFTQKLTSFDFIPDIYQPVVEQKDSIPGMKKLISSWNEYVSSYIAKDVKRIKDSTQEVADSIVFSNASEMVKQSNTSASQFLEQTRGNEFKIIIENLFDEIDFTILKNIVNQYNAWVESQNYKNKTNYTKIDFADCKEDLINKTYYYYKTTLQLYEEILRTTPDPYTDEVSKKVFGIN